ncbi:MAG: VOC family protein [Anaerolineae bacterium]|jgi:predicted enzyme related to lactoylglutathione lyase|nr:VOC family protein [Anaerolineae bacterium]
MARVTHFEIAVDDPQTSIDFYQNVFDWQVNKWEGPIEYWLIGTGESDTPGIDGALAPRADQQNQPITIVIEVEDAAAYIEKVAANGGEVIGELQEIPGVGISGYFRDPAGNILGLMQSFPMD